MLNTCYGKQQTKDLRHKHGNKNIKLITKIKMCLWLFMAAKNIYTKIQLIETPASCLRSIFQKGIEDIFL